MLNVFIKNRQLGNLLLTRFLSRKVWCLSIKIIVIIIIIVIPRLSIFLSYRKFLEDPGRSCKIGILEDLMHDLEISGRFLQVLDKILSKIFENILSRSCKITTRLQQDYHKITCKITARLQDPPTSYRIFQDLPRTSKNLPRCSTWVIIINIIIIIISIIIIVMFFCYDFHIYCMYIWMQ
jgi:hypothetical protein